MANSSDAISRPGVSASALERAGVRRVSSEEAKAAVGLSEPGLLIPYRTVTGDPVKDGEHNYGRVRLDSPPVGRGKYFQRPGSGVHVFVPPGLLELREAEELVLVEGEFKSLALVEGGVPAVGISGFYGYSTGGQNAVICPELAEALAARRPSRLLLLGDSDTSINHQFSIAAVRLQLLIGLPVSLPRISFSDPGKGVDDVRHALGGAFDGWWSRTKGKAVPVESRTAPQLAVQLWENDRLAIERLEGEDRARAHRRALAIACWLTSQEPLTAGSFIDAAAKGFGFKRADFQRAMKEENKRHARSGGLEPEEVEKLIAAATRGLFFDGTFYYRQEQDGRYHRLNRDDAKLHLKASGLDPKSCEAKDEEDNTASEAPKPGDLLSPNEKGLLRIQQQNRVMFAGQLCGRQPGPVPENGNLLLVTDGPTVIKGAAGNADAMIDFIENLLGKAAGDPQWQTQVNQFLGWLQRGRQAVTQPERHLPGLGLIIAGPVGCGKSLLQTLITMMLGGRSADPSLWLQGKTPFNDSSWGAEHLLMSDANLDDSWESRKAFRDKVKEVVASPLYPCHRKGRAEFSARPIWRISLTLNDDPNSITILPALDESIADKLLVLRAYSPSSPLGGDDAGEFFSKLVAAMPAFLRIVDSFVVPQELRKLRFGQREWHHPHILDLLEANNPDSELSEYLWSWLDGQHKNMEVTANELLLELEERTERRILRTIRTAAALGHALRRLSTDKRWNGIITKAKVRRGIDKTPTSVWRFTIYPEQQRNAVVTLCAS